MESPIEDFFMEQMAGGYRTITTREEFNGREVIVMRAGESIEDVFPDWVKQSRLDEHYYVPFDLNVPQSLPKRDDVTAAYKADPPLSEYGRLTSQVFARHLQSRGVPHKGPITIYTSPSLVCLQTAHEIYHYLKTQCNAIRIDPGLSAELRGFDYWLKTDDIRKLGYFIDQGYRANRTTERCESIYTTESRVLETVKDIGGDSERNVVLLITDALAASMINRYVRKLPTHFTEDILTERSRADEAIPPGSTLVFQPEYGTHLFLPRHLSPMTDINGTQKIDLDDGVDYSHSNRSR